jgi:hypothetical protein
MSLQFVLSPAKAEGPRQFIPWGRRDKTFLGFPSMHLVNVCYGREGGGRARHKTRSGLSRPSSLLASSTFLGAACGEIALWGRFINLLQFWKPGSLSVLGGLGGMV